MTGEPRAAAPELQQSEERFRLLVDSVKDYGIFMLDPAGRVLSWNSGARRLQGYEAHEIIGTHFSRFYPPEDIAAGKPKMELERAVAEGRIEDEGWRLRKDGSRFWANVVITALHDPQTGELRGFGKVTRDLTERRIADERLRRSEEQFRLLVESVEQYAIFMLDPGGYVATWNAGAQKTKGYTAEEIIGQHFARFYTPEDRAAGKPARLLSEARCHGSVRDHGVRVRSDGSTFHADVLITAIHAPGGALIGFSKVTRDVTEQIRTREVEAARIAAEKANQAKDDFLAVLSHELRTPLTPVLASAAYLEENLSTLDRSEILAELRAISRNTRLEAQLIDDLLDLTRISRNKIELHFEAVNLHSALEEAVAIVRDDAAEKGLQVALLLEARESWVWGDATRLRQVCWNLLTNAVKFTPQGGQVAIRTFNRPGEIVVEVSDTGIGIEPGQAKRIFDAFEQGERTVTRRFGGLGLGLAICRNLVEKHRGTIIVRSEGLGKGSTFQLTFTYLAQPSDAVPPKTGEARVSAQTLRILLVDDHEDTRRILGMLLRKDGHRVDLAPTAQAARALLATHPFDLLVSDIGLPDGSGHELMREARRHNPHVQGIALSGFGMEEDLRRSMEAGFQRHLTKPVDIGALRALLQEHAQGAR